MNRKVYREEWWDAESDSDNTLGLFEAEGSDCDIFQQASDPDSCEGWNIKLERDLIRQRDWEYSVLALDLPPDKREELRNKLIDQYGENLELLAPNEKAKPTPGSRKSKRKKRSAKCR